MPARCVHPAAPPPRTQRRLSCRRLPVAHAGERPTGRQCAAASLRRTVRSHSAAMRSCACKRAMTSSGGRVDYVVRRSRVETGDDLANIVRGDEQTGTDLVAGSARMLRSTAMPSACGM